MDQHLTVREACNFSGKSESTIKRLIREVNARPDHPDRGMILPPPDDVEHRKKVGDPFVWKIDQDLLLRRYPNDRSGKGSEGGREPGQSSSASSDDSGAVVQILREQLQSKDSQIGTLEKQLDRKDDQIKNLNERMHESNVLMRELQARLVIAAPARATTGETAVQTKARKGNDTIDSDISTPQKRPFFSGLFGRK